MGEREGEGWSRCGCLRRQVEDALPLALRRAALLLALVVAQTLPGEERPAELGVARLLPLRPAAPPPPAGAFVGAIGAVGLLTFALFPSSPPVSSAFASPSAPSVAPVSTAAVSPPYRLRRRVRVRRWLEL